MTKDSIEMAEKSDQGAPKSEKQNDPFFEQEPEEQALTSGGATLIYVSSMIGGSLISLPFAFYQLGLVFGTILLIVNGLVTINRAWLYLKSKDLIPGKPESMFEIGYYLFGRKSIFFISAMILIWSAGICLIVTIVLGETWGTMIEDIFGLSLTESHWFGVMVMQKQFWCVFVGIVLAPVIVKKELKEMHFVSIALFVSLVVMCSTLVLQLIIHGFIQTSNDSIQLSFSQLWLPAKDSTALLQVRSINLFVLGYAFTSNLFPVYSGLKNKNNDECIKAVSWATLITAIVYTILGWTTLALFGNPMLTHVNFMNSVNHEYHLHPKLWEAFVIRIAYITLLMCHIPFLFFNGKEALLLMIDEIDRKSCSQVLETRMKILEKQGIEDTIMQTAGSIADNEGPFEFTNKIKTKNLTDRGAKIQMKNLTFEASPNEEIQADMKMNKKDADLNQSQRIEIRNSILQDGNITRRYTSEIGDLRRATIDPTKILGGGKDGSDNKLAYKDMKDLNYYLATLIYLLSIVILACIVPNVDIVFDLLSLVAINAICFFFPAFFYLFGVKKQQATEGQGFQAPRNKCLEATAYATVAAGVGSFIMGAIDTYNVIGEAFEVVGK